MYLLKYCHQSNGQLIKILFIIKLSIKIIDINQEINKFHEIKTKGAHITFISVKLQQQV